MCVCWIPQRVLENMCKSSCSSVIDREAGTVDIVNNETGERMIGLKIGPVTGDCEMVLVRDKGICFSHPIRNLMTVDPSSIDKPPAPIKKQPKKRKEPVRLKEIHTDRFSIDTGPIASQSDFDDKWLLRVKIEETLEFAETLEDKAEKMNVLSELTTFVLKETKTNTDLEEMRECLSTVRMKRDIGELSQHLYRFAMKF